MTGLVLLVVALAAAVLGVRWLLADPRTLPAGSGRPGSVSVVVPARDEEQTLPALLSSVTDLEKVREVVVVDDASVDATAAVAHAGGARVVSPGEPPAGWTGKAWACQVGADATDSDLLLFLDADTRLSPRAASALVGMHSEVGGLVSAQPFHTVERPYEQLSAYFNAVSVLASGAFTRRPARPLAFGPCLLTSRTDYERVGGHAAVSGEVLDDVQLAAAYQRAGLPVTCALGGADVRMRSYPGGLSQLFAGWTKNIASGAGAAAAAPTVLTVLWVGAHHGVVATAVTSAIGGTTPVEAAVLLAAWLVVAWQLRAVLRLLGSFRWWTWLLFPLPLLVFDLVFARSLAQTARGSVRWRGRRVDLRPREDA